MIFSLRIPTLPHHSLSNNVQFLMLTMCRTIILIGGISISLLSFLHAQIKDISFEHLTVDDGLSQNTILAIHQDKQGFLWFGTEDGLNRYDGYAFTVFKSNPADSTTLSNNFIRNFFEDHSGNLWLGTLNGVSKFDLRTEKCQRYTYNPANQNSLSTAAVLSLLEDHRGMLWIGTRKGGLNRLDPNTGSISHMNPSIDSSINFPTITIFALYEDAAGVLWLGTSIGLLALDGDRLHARFYPMEGVVPTDNVILSIHEDGENILWLGTMTDGLIRFDRKDNAITQYKHDPNNPNSISANRVWKVLEDKNGLFWIATEDGLNIFERRTQRFTAFKHDPDKAASLSLNHVLSMFEDQSGVLWFGTLNGGINKYNRRSERFPLIQHQAADINGISNNGIWAFCEDRSGIFWVGTEDGLNRFEPSSGIWSVLKHEKDNSTSLSNDVVTSIEEDRNGNLWIGTRAGGLNLMDRKLMTFKHFTHQPNDSGSLSVNGIVCIFEDADGAMWFGTDGGGLARLVSLFGGKAQFKTYRSDAKDRTSLSTDLVGTMYEDKAGRFWIGTFGGGLNALDRTTEKFTRYVNDPNERQSLSDNIVTSLYEDPSGLLWIGTAAGLNAFDLQSGKFKRYTVKDGMTNDFIYGILPDTMGNLWLSTNHGIIRFNIAHLSESEDSLSLSKRFKNFDVRDGLQGNEFNSGAFFASASSELFFGGSNGFNRFSPERVTENTHKPAVVLTSFRKLDRVYHFDRALPAVEHIDLLYTDYFFSFEFAALDFTDPSKNLFQYMLEGFDHDWINAGTRRFVTYTNLDHGSYVFKVRGSNNDGIWSETGASVAVVIQPPFWKTWWFLSLLIIGIIGIATSLYRYRLHQLLAMERLRVRLAADLHDELATNLSSIAMFGEILQKPQDVDDITKSQLLDRMTTLARESVGSVREIIWTIDSKPEKLYNLLMRFKDMIQASCRAKNIALHFTTPSKEELGGMTQNPEVRKELWFILKEAVNNAMKHSKCSTLNIDVTLQGRSVCVIIVDNGCGFDLSGSFKGKGLGTMRMRAGKLRGSFDISSTPGEGTTITLSAEI